jgi:hypothetical protein
MRFVHTSREKKVMGRYINPPGDWSQGAKGKQQYAEQLGATKCTAEEALAAVNSGDKAVLVWVDNGWMEALAYAYSERELKYFLDVSDDPRPKQTFIIAKSVAEQHAK